MTFGVKSKGLCQGIFNFWLKAQIIVSLILVSANVYGLSPFRLIFQQERLGEVSDFSFLPQGLTYDMLAGVPADGRNNHNRVTILSHNGTFYAFRDCFFDVNVWRDTAWVNLYPWKLYGYNCLSRPMLIGGQFYSLGGYGFYRRHSELISWSPGERRWNIVPVANLPDDYSSAVIGQVGDTIISLFGTYLNESKSLLTTEPYGFLLDLKNRQWRPLVIRPNPFVDGKGNLSTPADLDDYLVFENHTVRPASGFYVLDKKTFRLYFWEKHNLLEKSPIVFSQGNTLIYSRPGSRLACVDFSLGREEFEHIGEIRIAENVFNPFIAATGGLLVLGALGVLFFNRQKLFRLFKAKNGFDPDLIDLMLSRLSKHSGKTLQVDELDLILEINQFQNLDYRRVRRSKLIGDINLRFKAAYGRELIARQRNQNDKRLMEYAIS